MLCLPNLHTHHTQTTQRGYVLVEWSLEREHTHWSLMSSAASLHLRRERAEERGGKTDPFLMWLKLMENTRYIINCCLNKCVGFIDPKIPIIIHHSIKMRYFKNDISLDKLNLNKQIRISILISGFKRTYSFRLKSYIIIWITSIILLVFFYELKIRKLKDLIYSKNQKKKKRVEIILAFYKATNLSIRSSMES